ncbi:MAG: DUF3108 domain-containing protein [Chthoniobacterales bacterium]
MRFSICVALGLGATFFGQAASAAPAWEKTVTSSERGAFPNPRPMRANYRFGWNDVVAATAEINFGANNGRLELIGTGQTTGVVRALWRFDVQHRATADATTLRPIAMHQVDELRHKTVTTDLTFSATGVTRTRTDNKATKPPTPKEFDFPGLVDLHTALLLIRSQPLVEGTVQRLVVYPATNGYLATISVAGRESIKVGAGTYQAIKLDLQLSKINKQRELEPHKKFRQASAWISDDADRLLLRIEAKVFVGTVFVDLESVHFGEKR